MGTEQAKKYLWNMSYGLCCSHCSDLFYVFLCYIELIDVAFRHTVQYIFFYESAACKNTALTVLNFSMSTVILMISSMVSCGIGHAIITSLAALRN